MYIEIRFFFNIFTVAQYHKALKQLFKPQILLYQVIFFMKLLNDIHNSIACMKKYMYLICLLHNVIIFFSVRLPRRCTEYDLQSVTPACKLYMNMFNRNFKTFVLGFTADLHPINLSFNLPSRFFLPSLVKSTK